MVVAGFSFLLLFSFVDGCGYVDNFAFGRGGILLARPCGKIEREAEAVRSGAFLEARSEDRPRLPFARFSLKTGHYLGP